MQDGIDDQGEDLVGNLMSMHTQVSGKDDTTSDGSPSNWEKFVKSPTSVKRRERWSRNENLDLENIAWNKVLVATRTVWNNVDVEGMVNLYEPTNDLIQGGVTDANINIFEEFDGMVECLAKWEGCDKLKDHEAWKKVQSVHGQRTTWLDVERNACHEEEDVHRKKKKRNKKNSDKEGKKKGKGLNVQDIRVWKKQLVNPPERNIKFGLQKIESRRRISTKKVNFQKDFIPPKVATQPLGLSDFNRGNDKEHGKKVKGGSKKQKVTSTRRLRKKKRGLRRDKCEEEKKEEAASRNENVNGNMPNQVNELGSAINVNDSILHKEQPESSRRSHSLEEQVTNSDLKGGMEKETNNDTGMERNTNKGRKSTNSRKPVVSMVENTNHFCLSDEEGNEIMDAINDRGDKVDEVATIEGLNNGWIKKQERNLNAKYNREVTKEQRYEAKKYVLDRLMPLAVVLSNWPNPQLEYFRSLCSLYNFGEGFLAVTCDKYHRIGKSNNDTSKNEELMEEVESETDGIAVFMKDDLLSDPS
ncbi:hypothetical protein L1987_18212 [Smallanthus sonchifolius]|uniref:Uncharacterized protein n=1 Tax=Smallanthus sonchifolius TaxID=185202 RepID=A0ACB9IZG4_9ASTR|nr:hypothetical protein L1987_18212 [Smallanthus sonchifolius]